MSPVVLRVAVLACCVLSLLGCGGATGRKPVTGSIVGADVRNGLLILVPANGVNGPSAQTEITGGKFKFDTTTGPWVGTHIARVRLETAATSAPPADRNIKEIPVTAAEFETNPLALEEFEVEVRIPESAPFQVEITPPVRP